MTIGERIKALREEKGWSQDDLRKKLGYTSRATIHYIETGRNELTAAKVVKFAEALGTTHAYLMGWEKPLSDEEYFILEEVSKDSAMKDRLMAYALKLKGILDDETNA